MKKTAIIAAICFTFALCSCAEGTALPQSNTDSVLFTEQTAKTNESTETAGVIPEETADIAPPVMPLVSADTEAAKCTEFLGGTLDTIISVHDEDSYLNKEHIRLARELILGTEELCEQTEIVGLTI